MRRAWLLVLLAAVPVSAGEPRRAPTQEMTDLWGLQARLDALKEYEDNEFIHEEKVAELYREARAQSEGATVTIGLKVDQVRKNAVLADPEGTPEVFERFPVVHLLGGSKPSKPIPAGPEVQFREIFMRTDRIGGFWGLKSAPPAPGTDTEKRMFELEVGSLIPVEMAKILRRGDRLVVRGKVERLVMSTFDWDGVSMTWVVTNAKVEREPKVPTSEK